MKNEELIVILSRKVCELEIQRDDYQRWWLKAKDENSSLVSQILELENELEIIKTKQHGN